MYNSPTSFHLRIVLGENYFHHSYYLHISFEEVNLEHEIKTIISRALLRSRTGFDFKDAFIENLPRRYRDITKEQFSASQEKTMYEINYTKKDLIFKKVFPGELMICRHPID